MKYTYEEEYIIMLNAIQEIAQTNKGYPNGSREGSIALEVLKKMGLYKKIFGEKE